jgi:predicted LPLAT superfamily acyltransferase
VTIQTDWAEQPERGGRVVVNALLWLVLGLGPRASGRLVAPLSLWFLATSGAARAASRDYLSRILGRPARLRDVLRHFHCFGAAILDRVFLLASRTAGFSITTEGLELVASIVARRRGCVLLGAHLGSFEVLRSLAAQAPAPVWALMYRGNAGALTDTLEQLNPGLRQSVIEIGDTAGMLRVSECIARGEIVGILADRIPSMGKPGHRLDKRQIAVPFLGGKALFPAGPFVLAAVLGAPVVLFHGVRTGPQRYAVRFETFAERVVLRRAARNEDLREVVGRYAAALERACRDHPFNWFNFFPFWEHGDDAARDPQPVDAPEIDIAVRADPYAGDDVGRGAAGRIGRVGGSAVPHARA